MDLIGAHNAIKLEDRRNILYKDGTIKTFIEVVNGDEFQFILTDGTVQPTFYRCTATPYINGDNIPTIKVDILL